MLLLGSLKVGIAVLVGHLVVLVQGELASLFLGLSLLGGVGLLSLHAVGRSLCGLSTIVGEALVELREVRDDLVAVVGLPELQVSRALEQLTDTLRLTDTWHFDHDTAVLSLELLDIGLNDTELIDTVADHVERVVDGRLNLSAQCLLNLRVAALCAHLALQLLCSEDLGKAMARCILLVSVDKQ